MTVLAYVIVGICILCGLCATVQTVGRAVATRNIAEVHVTLTSANNAEFILRSALLRYPNAEVCAACAPESLPIAQKLSRDYPRIIVRDI